MSQRAIWIPTVFLVMVCALIAVSAPGPVRNTSRFGRVLLPEMIPTRDIVYSFEMNEDGLSGIQLATSAVSAPPVGRVRFRLYAHDNPAPLAEGEVPTDQLARDGRYLFRFTPIGDSHGSRYLLNISSSPGSQARGVAFWGTNRRLPDTSLIIGGRAQPATPVFRTIVGVDPAVGAPSRTARWRVVAAVGALTASLVTAGAVIRSLVTRA
jgi:hypothetical protein